MRPMVSCPGRCCLGGTLWCRGPGFRRSRFRRQARRSHLGDQGDSIGDRRVPAASGGGRVVLGPGVYLSGTVVLKSRVTLWLEPGSTLRGSGKLDDYPQHKPAVRSYTDEYVDRSLIAGENLRRRGHLRPRHDRRRGRTFPLEQVPHPAVRHSPGELPRRARRGSHDANSPMWMQHYLACDRVMLRGLTVVNLGARTTTVWTSTAAATSPFPTASSIPTTMRSL